MFFLFEIVGSYMYGSRPYFVEELSFKFSKYEVDDWEDIFRRLCIYLK